jgi:hypothetical protein
MIRWWGPIPMAFQHHNSIIGIGPTETTHREFARHLANTPLDLAIVPHDGSPAERAWLDFAVCHIACVVGRGAASPTIRHGETAVVAGETPEAWIQTVAALASQTAVRSQIAQAAWHEAVATRSTQQNAPLWMELFQSAKAGDPVEAGALAVRE